MYTYLYVYKSPRQFMSGKLYWRYKKDGKWTWKSAVYSWQTPGWFVQDMEEEEE